MRSYHLTHVDSAGSVHFKHSIESIPLKQAKEFRPMREPTAYKGQKHMPGYFYMSNMGQLVAYESRLEMVVLLQLDFNPSTSVVISQPFILHVTEGKKAFEHYPDFLVISESGEVLVIDVKPKKYVNDAKNVRAFKATSAACKRMGWNYSVQSEPNRLFLTNLRWLAGYRRYRPTVEIYARTLIEACQVKALSIKELVQKVGHPAVVRPVLFHLLWHRFLEIDMHAHLTNDLLVDLPKGAFNYGI